MAKTFFFFHGGDGKGTDITIVAANTADCARVYDQYQFEWESRARFRTHWSKMPYDAEIGIPLERGAYIRKGNSSEPYRIAKLKKPISDAERMEVAAWMSKL